MAALSQLGVVVGDCVVTVEKLSDQTSLKQYIEYNCQVSERDVSDNSISISYMFYDIRN